MKAVIHVLFLTFLCSVIIEVSAQDTLKLIPVGPNDYVPKIENLKPQKNFSNKNAAYYTTFLILSSGYYERVNIDATNNWQHTFPSVHFGDDMDNKSTVNAGAWSSGRYSDQQPPEVERSSTTRDVICPQAAIGS